MDFLRKRDTRRKFTIDFDGQRQTPSLALLSRVVWGGLLTIALLPARASAQSAQPSGNQSAPVAGTAIYRQLRTAGLNTQDVYKIRDVSIDREDIHLSLNDGTIALIEPVNGRITGALFVGQGEILLIPPNQVERQSLALFTKAAVLSEVFTMAYFRFSDDKLIESLRPSLWPPESAADFVQQYGSVAKALAEADALRTLVALTRESQPHRDPKVPTGDFMRAHLSGVRLGTFDVFFDTLSNEQISVSRASYTEKGRFYDQWTSFPMRSMRQSKVADSGATEDAISANRPYEPIFISDYNIRASVRPPTDLAVDTTIKLDARYSGDRILVFELSRYLKVSSVTVNSASAPVSAEFIQNEAIEGSQLARSGNDLVAVILPRALIAGEQFKLKFSYSGSVLSDAGGGLLYVGARGTWYPSLGPAMSNFDLEFRSPAAWKLLATGRLVSRSLEADGREVSHWRSEQRIPLAGFNLGRYVSDSSTSKTEFGEIMVEAFATRAMENAFTAQRMPPPTILLPPTRGARRPQALDFPVTSPDPAANARSVAEQSAKAIDFLSPRLGRFPYASLSITQRPGADSQGWPGLVFLSSYAFLSERELDAHRRQIPSDDATQILYERVMVAHETAHQWWGDAVFWRDYRSQWLIEALANYCAVMQLETERPEQFKVMMDSYRRKLEQPDLSGSGRPVKEAGPVSLGIRLNSSQFPTAYENVVYGRGTWLIHMLRQMLRDGGAANAVPPHLAGARTRHRGSAQIMGPLAKPAANDPDALFFSVLRGLLDKLRGRLISNQDLKSAFEAALPTSLRFEGKQSLDWFFDGWVDGVALPRYELEDLKFTTLDGKTIAQASLHQKDAPESLVTSVPIYASMGTGQPVFVTRVFADGEETAIRLTVPRGTKRLLVDPFHTVLTAK